jgi:hypothetical protein
LPRPIVGARGRDALRDVGSLTLGRGLHTARTVRRRSIRHAVDRREIAPRARPIDDSLSAATTVRSVSSSFVTSA